MAKKSTHKQAEKRKQEEVKQASVVLSVIGVIGLTAVIISAQYSKADIPAIVYAIFAGIIVPPEVLKRVLKGFIGNDK